METMKSTSSNRKGRSSIGWTLQHKFFAVSSLLACCFASACRDAMAPTGHIVPVTPVVRNVEPLPHSIAILPSTPLATVPLATYDMVEGVLVEAMIDGFVHVTSNVNASAVHVNDDVDYKGVYDFSRSGQCDWAATISSPQLSVPGFGGCQSAEPRYTKTQTWLDTLVLGGYGGNGVITARRGGGSGDPEYCSDGSLCHVVTGLQTVTLTPLPAVIRLIAPNRTEVAPKTILIPDPSTLPISFTVSSTPSTYHGITVPRRALSWQWIPASGDSAQSTLACPLPPASSNSYTCAGYIYERGSVVVSARVNGVVQVDTMKVTGPQVQLTLEKTSMRPSVLSYTGVLPAAVHNETQSVQVSVVDTAGHLIPNQTVRLALTATEGSAGHVHINGNLPKPPGTIPIIVNTGASGTVSTTYTAPEPSGPVWLKGSVGGTSSVMKQIKIEVPGLARYGPELGADTVGGIAGAHTDNHYATAAHIGRLAALVFMYNRQFPNGPRLKLNDSSLQLGGLFDVNKDWHPDHAGHRWGNNTDVRTHNGSTAYLSQLQINAIQGIWMNLIGRGTQGIILHPVGGRVAPHIHLAY
jgi:hypothetical protein